MSCFIKKIFENRIDELVHIQFQKFSRGTFKDRALIKASNSSKGFSLSTGNEFANDLVRAVAQKAGAAIVSVSGVIVSTADLKSKVPYTDLKQFMGIKQYVISGEMKGSDIIALLDSLPEAFFALSFSFGDTILKIKPKAPKSAKPSTSDKEPKIDFCSLKTADEHLISSLLFDVPAGWKKMTGAHEYIIEDIELPKGVSNPLEMRRLAKRKGILVRKLIIDDKEVTTKKEFIA